MMNAIIGFFKKFPGMVKKLLKSRSMKYGANSMILVVVVAALAVMLNMVVDLADVKLDLTPNKLFTISDNTKDILDGLDKDVTIYGFFDEGKLASGDEYKELVDILDQYTKYPHIKLDIQDPDRNPGFIKEVDPEDIYKPEKNDFVVKCGTKMKKLSYYDLFDTQLDYQSYQSYKIGSKAEQGFTGAVKFVIAEKTPTVYFTEGHKELSPNGDYSNVKEYLEMNNYAVATLNLLTSAAIPEDAEMVIMVSPTTDLSEKERLVLEAYFEKGGKAIFLFDSMQNGPEFTQINKMLSEYNLAVNNDKIMETDDAKHMSGDPYTLVLNVPGNAIVPEGFQTVLSASRSIKALSNLKEYITLTPLAVTSDTAVGEQIDKAAGPDNAGPMNMAVAVEHKGRKDYVKVLVMGNASFIADNAAELYGPYYETNIRFFLYSMNWIQGAKDDNIIAPKAYTVNTIKINAAQATATGIAVVVILPLLILGVGTYVYMRRRHL